MLKSLSIKNFVIIEDQHIEFGAGLNVLSGESGAGKSIILDALELLLGGRSRGDFFRAETEAWELEALFEVSSLPSEIISALPDLARSVLDDSTELVLSRSLSRSGKAKCFIGGRLASVKMLAEVGRVIMSICTQKESLILLDSSKQRYLLDSFAGLDDAVAAYTLHYEAWRANKRKLEKLVEDSLEAARSLEDARTVLDQLSPLEEVFLQKPVIEQAIKDASLLEGDLQTLQNLRNLCVSEQGIMSLIAEFRREMRGLSPQFSLKAELGEALEGCSLGIDAIDELLAQASRGGDFSEAELEQMRSQISDIAKLERKFRKDPQGLLELLQETAEKIAELEDREGGEAKLRKTLEEQDVVVRREAQKLRAKRVKAAIELSGRGTKELAELGFVASRLRIEVSEVEPNPFGCDAVSILFQSNPGEPEKLLEEVASGGEISRLMLVLRSLIGSKQGTQVLVFDEVDSGVSGVAARAMGKKLRELGRTTQVLCVSHLPQVASLAERHFVIRKETGSRTRSVVIGLESESDRIEEIARMLSGYTVTPAARESAKELIASKDERRA